MPPGLAESWESLVFHVLFCWYIVVSFSIVEIHVYIICICAFEESAFENAVSAGFLLFTVVQLKLVLIWLLVPYMANNGTAWRHGHSGLTALVP